MSYSLQDDKFVGELAELQKFKRDIIDLLKEISVEDIKESQMPCSNRNDLSVYIGALQPNELVYRLRLNISEMLRNSIVSLVETNRAKDRCIELLTKLIEEKEKRLEDLNKKSRVEADYDKLCYLALLAGSGKP